ncbi:MAG: hypothetical protein JRF63_13665, partial [Deltaproteobacteria bacterium]|nr:hypothetical protein [Deltaproteobacteria bacterium]
CTYGCEFGACVVPDCTTGVCCNTATYEYRPDTYQCDTGMEYGCAGSVCGADGQERTMTQYCPGSGSDCNGAKVYGSWSTTDFCTLGQLCQSDLTSAWCVDCEFGCSGSSCDPDPCDGVTCTSPPANYCADADNLTVYDVPGTCSGGTCSYTTHNEFCSFGCTGGACEGDPCQGVTCLSPPADYCVDGNTARQYNVPGTCTDGICDYTYSDAACTYGCSGGVCNPPECSSGVCCSGGWFRPASYVCDSWTEYGCAGSDCGSDAQERAVQQYCSGANSICVGSVVEGGWSTVHSCAADQICQYNSSDSWCFTCTEGCTAGSCDSIGCGLAVMETFDTATLPSGWSVYDGDGYLSPDGYTWQHTTSSPPPGGSLGHWWVDSDGPGSGGPDFYEALYTTWYDGTGCDTANLEFDHYYNYYDDFEYGAVMMTSDGSTWNTLAIYELADDSGHKTLNLHPELWTSGSFQVKWLYVAHYDYYWKIDNVEMSGTP